MAGVFAARKFLNPCIPPQAVALLGREAFKVLPTLACLLFGTALALHVLYGEGSALLEGTDLLEGFAEGFRTFGASCGTVARAGLGDFPAANEDVP